MNSPSKEIEEPTVDSTVKDSNEADSGSKSAPTEEQRPPAKRRLSSTVIEISDTESDDSDVCAVNSYQASADEVKRIRGDYSSSSSSSSSEYSSDSESPWEDDSILLEDEVEIKVVKAKLNIRANRMDNPKLNPALMSQELIDTLGRHWKELKDHTTSELSLICEPFRVCRLHDVLANPEIINNIVDDMNTLDWSRKKMDLYEFHQTADLANLTWQRSIRGIYDLLQNELMPWVSKVTGLQLSSVSASCSLYGPGDHLLVHDDLLADRRVAFILYLAPWQCQRTTSTLENGDHAHSQAGGGWSESMGGALELFARDAAGPTEVVRKIYPRNNTLAFFKVGADSYHQVGEVLSMELPRLSINGWFHGPPPEGGAQPEQPEQPAQPTQPTQRDVEAPPAPLPPHSDIVLLGEWVEPTYMAPRCRAQVQAQMERDSEASLQRFLQPQRYREVLHALVTDGCEWERCGPADRRSYSRVSEAWARQQGRDSPVGELLRLLGSAAWLRMLCECTDLALGAVSGAEVQRWRRGDYSLLPARASYCAARLETVLFVGEAPRGPGGARTFVAPEAEADSGALLSLPCEPNALNLVYCDAGAAAFANYVSRLAHAKHDHFFVVVATYHEAD